MTKNELLLKDSGFRLTTKRCRRVIKAMQGLIATPQSYATHAIAIHAYKMADAMMKARAV